MNNIKKLSIILLLSMGVSEVGFASGSGCNNNGCNTSNNNCNTCFDNNSNGCGNNNCGSSNNCNNSNNCGTTNNNCNRSCGSTVFVPRDITGNLTWRNDLTFYNRYHDARCNFFTWDNTFLYEQTRRSKCLGAAFLGGVNPTTIGETGANIESLNFGLGSTNGNFESTICLRPRREVFAWLPQFIFNLDCLCTGFWADVSFAVAHARHKLHFDETPSTAAANITGQPTTVLGAFAALDAFSTNCRHTGVDNVLVRIGYDYTYCNNDHFGAYFLGLIPTGKNFNNAQFFAPVIGSKHGGVGVGVEGDYTFWNCDDQDLVFMTELKYTYRFKHRENRVFDLNNGPLSRFLLAAPSTNPCLPTNIVSNLTSCVEVKPRSQVDFWLGLHYQWCNWGLEFDYNLYWRQRERVCGGAFNFDSLGLYNLNCGCGTSNSTATIATEFGAGTADATFTQLTAANVNLQSGEACKALTNAVSGALSYNNVWCDCYPWEVGIGGKYEFASKKDRRSLPESWGVFGKATISF